MMSELKGFKLVETDSKMSVLQRSLFLLTIFWQLIELHGRL